MHVLCTRSAKHESEHAGSRAPARVQGHNPTRGQGGRALISFINIR